METALTLKDKDKNAPTGPRENLPTPMRTFVLWYIHWKGNLGPRFKVFELKGSLYDAKLEGRRHCDVMGMKFIKVLPHVVNLREQERLKHGNPEYDPDDDAKSMGDYENGTGDLGE